MAKGHEFNFYGGTKLTVIGATWFVSYTYYDLVDTNHNKWENVKTWKSRRSVYNNTQEYHRYWLEQIEKMNDNFLKKNKIDLSPSETKRMAKIILSKLNSN